MKSIFWKIFLSFWLVMLAVVSVTTVLGLQVGDRWADQYENADRWKALRDAVDVFESGGIDELRTWVLDPTNIPPGQTIYVMNSDGEDFLAREMVDIRGRRWAEDNGDFFGGRRGGPGVELEELDGTIYQAYLGRAKPQLLGVLSAPAIRQTVIPVALLSSALACFFLSKYLTRPLNQVVEAARDLERGDLGRRSGISANRSDEIGVLGRQFDSMAEQIERNDSTRRELFRNLSHELRTPLARIHLASELARREPDKVNEHLNRIESESMLLETMTRQMLALARIQFTESDDADEIDIVEIVSLVVEDARFEGRQDKKNIIWVPTDGKACTRGNVDLFRSAVENVVRNAIQYTPKGSTVLLEAQQNDDCYELTVSDEGNGVPETRIDQVFEPFNRADSEIDGVGIGLAITFQVITQMGGTVNAKNLKQGGFQIAMTVPIAI